MLSGNATFSCSLVTSVSSIRAGHWAGGVFGLSQCHHSAVLRKMQCVASATQDWTQNFE